jgi:hypothetical protein
MMGKPLTHGMTYTAEYRIWGAMKTRCYNPNHVGYARYGGRGIKVCRRWRQSFMAFYRDMGPRPSNGHSLDRLDPDGDYEPGNVRWATWKQQGENKRHRLSVTYDGRSQSIKEWSSETGIPGTVLYLRIFFLGWDIDRAMKESPRPRRKRSEMHAHQKPE